MDTLMNLEVHFDLFWPVSKMIFFYSIPLLLTATISTHMTAVVYVIKQLQP